MTTTALPTLAIMVTLLLAASPAVAQDVGGTREEELRAMRAEKAQQLEKERQGTVERVLVGLEQNRLLERLLSPPEGFYPRIGHVTPGSAFSLGVGYRQPRLFGERAVVSASAMGSVKKYWVLETRLLMPRLADEAAEVQVYAQRSSWPEEAFYGVGPDTPGRVHTNYSLDNTLFGGSGAVKAGRLLSVGGRVEHMTLRAGRGRAERIPTIGDRFPIGQTPGLGQTTSFGRFEAFADLNYREPRLNPRRGGRYYVGYALFEDLDLDRYGFHRLEVDLQQYIPFLMERRVLAFHALLSASDAGTGEEVPFYLMRSLGGPNDLRGLRRHRFRDRNILLLQAEYRWEVFTAVDAALFVDAGQVAPRVGDFAVRDLETDYGLGLRFGTINGVFLRVEGAFGSRDGSRLVFTFSHVF